jgi:hypothetical protein
MPSEFAKQVFQKMAIKDVPRGTPLPEKRVDGAQAQVHDYTHVLDEAHRKAGYSLEIAHGQPNWLPNTTEVKARLHYLGNFVGRLEGTIVGGNLNVYLSRINKEHRRKGLGERMYEGMMAHAHHVLGAARVTGDEHSTAAHATHEKLAAKHKLNYKAGYKGAESYFGDEPGAMDFAYGPYDYTLKSEKWGYEDPIEVGMSESVSNLRSKDDESVHQIATSMLGFSQQLSAALHAARYLVNGSDPSLDLVRKCVAEYEDPYAAALATYRIEPTLENLEALSLVLDSEDFAKSLPNVEHYLIRPAVPEASQFAESVQAGVDSGYINPIKLNGKHSSGAHVVKDPDTEKVYLLKPGSGDNSPAAGVKEESATQSEREAAFWHVADALGLGGCLPRCELVLVDNYQTACMELLPLDYRNLGIIKDGEPNAPSRILEPYRQNGTLFKWSLLDYICGNPDRHSQNIMVDKKGRHVMLIDHGSAFAGRGFNPAYDHDSFIPYYLRAWTGMKFTHLQPSDRVMRMPGLSREEERIFDAWVKDINQHRIADICRQYHILPGPVLERLNRVLALPGPKWLVLNRLWAGVA